MAQPEWLTPLLTDRLEMAGAWSASVTAILVLAGILYRKVVLPVWRAAWLAVRNINLVADVVLGDKTLGVPSLNDRLAGLAKVQGEQGAEQARQSQQLMRQGEQLIEQGDQIATHQRWHGDPAGRPARQGPQRPNGIPRKAS